MGDPTPGRLDGQPMGAVILRALGCAGGTCPWADRHECCVLALSPLAPAWMLPVLAAHHHRRGFAVRSFICSRTSCECLASRQGCVLAEVQTQHLTCWASFQNPPYPFAFLLSAPSHTAETSFLPTIGCWSSTVVFPSQQNPLQNIVLAPENTKSLFMSKS